MSAPFVTAALIFNPKVVPATKQIIEIGKKLNINTYNLEQMYNLLKFKGELLGIYEKNEELEKILH